MLGPGKRLHSQVDDTEVIVVRTDDEVDELQCGGHPMVDVSVPSIRRLVPQHDAMTGNQLGKRYTLPDSRLEILVTNPGQGTLSAAGRPLYTKEARPLPASD